jgi:hypothetical protein
MTPAPSAGVLEGREHLLPVRVYYEDTDFTGIVYHANYLRYFERGRSDFLRLMGVSHTELREKARADRLRGAADGDRFPQAGADRRFARRANQL